MHSIAGGLAPPHLVGIAVVAVVEMAEVAAVVVVTAAVVTMVVVVVVVANDTAIIRHLMTLVGARFIFLLGGC